ncbi:MAG: hypothetical protein CVV44_19140 [Spirochaetae bacterium HGW-Spirochaetae-1]|jgi:penicillin-binding protein 1A|nr:MAG: hypothetical protein CVV44_19140 [Spirochaetae bacterium HGW-Spirochaetae-1]
MKILKALVGWILSHKKLVFIYIPFIIIFVVISYSAVIYVSWLGNRQEALDKLARYKQLIDRTEEMHQGYTYSYSDIDLSAKVVDIPTRIYDRNNEIIGEFFEQKREIVPYGSIPEWIVKGVIASEDRDFYSHHGLNYLGIFRAFIINMVNFSVVQGGSTITQQLAKVLFTDMERSFKRKIYEAFCALEIEKQYDKQDIISMYLNLIYFGNGAYGVESTSKMFFGKSVKDINEVECAMIVATISSPRTYSPISNLDNSIKKTRRILKSLVDAGYSRKERADYQYGQFLKKWDVVFENDRAISSLIGNFIYSSYRVNRCPFFNEQIRRLLVEKFGDDVVKKGGLSVYTTIDAVRQDVALESLRSGIKKQREYHMNIARRTGRQKIREAETEKAENIEGALVAVNPVTGEILSYVGGYEFSVKNQNDNVNQIVRQPGSSFKPIIYAAALMNGDITPSTVMMDEKTVYDKGYSPENYSRTYEGKVTIREALRRSINTIAVKVLAKTGYSTIFSIVQKALDVPRGDLNKRFGKTLSLALGTYELSPLENCVLHATLVNGGDFIKAYGIKYVKDYNGNIVWNYEEEVLREIEEKRNSRGKIIDPVAAAVTVSMLKGVFEKGGTAYYVGKGLNAVFPVAGKTGTSTNYNDAWFVGYTADLVTAVWIGNKQGAISLGPGRAGGVVSAPVWAEFIARTYVDKNPGDFKIPEKGVSEEVICNLSGQVALRDGSCPETAKQLFYSGTEPGEFCTMHRRAEGEEEVKSENK